MSSPYNFANAVAGMASRAKTGSTSSSGTDQYDLELIALMKWLRQQEEENQQYIGPIQRQMMLRQLMAQGAAQDRSRMDSRDLVHDRQMTNDMQDRYREQRAREYNQRAADDYVEQERQAGRLHAAERPNSSWYYRTKNMSDPIKQQEIWRQVMGPRPVTEDRGPSSF